MGKNKFLATTTSGLEEITLHELESLGSKAVDTSRGKVLVESDLSFVYRANYCSRTANKIFYVIHEAEGVKSLEDVRRELSSLDFNDFISEDQTFEVRFERFGKHDFTSLDINALVGSVIIEEFKKETGKRLKVDLSNPDVSFFGWLIEDKLIFSINTSGDSLHKRSYRRSRHPAPLKPTVASSLVYLSGWGYEKILLDPMCGSGTIPIEAAMMGRKIPPAYFRQDFSFFRLKMFDLDEFFEYKKKIDGKIEWEKHLEIYGLDKNPKFIEGAKRNAAKAKVDDTIEFKVGDATKLGEFLDFEPDYVIVNPPYGHRLGYRSETRKLYEGFIDSLSQFSGLRRLVVMTSDTSMERIARKFYELKEKKVVLYGNLTTLIYIYTA
ncbi:MAG: tRNA (guanine(6)-N2)-methyltransferase [Candidatus Asgardarchaeia archaeon]